MAIAPRAIPPFVISMGDPAGIGPEITLKAWAALCEDIDHAFAVIGPLSIFQDTAQRLDLPRPRAIDTPRETAKAFGSALPVLDMGACPPVTAGVPNVSLAPFITGSIERGVGLCLSGNASALITAPIAKEVLYDAGFAHPGHTEYLGELTKDAPLNAPQDMPRGPVMMLSGGGLRVALATVHLPLKDAAAQLSEAAIIRTARVMDLALRVDFGVKNPRISLTGLNPHAGEGGALGREEIEIINPAAAKLRAIGINATNAQPADTLFHTEAREAYDAVLAMYHDQGLIPVKTLDFHGGVNVTLGLPIVRTSPDHGTAFGIAGKGIARADSLIAAIKAAREIAHNRAKYHKAEHDG